jgi:peptide/nickel transport system substrate-binding protein
MHIKTGLFGLMAILLILSLILPGCGSNTTTTTTSKPTSSTTTTTTSNPTATSTTTTTSITTTSTTTTPTTQTSNADMYGGIYHYPLNVAPASPLGYPVETNPVEGLVASCALERLLLTGDNGFIDPRLATSWEVNVPTKAMTFHLRQGVKFHDGSDFNAEVVKWNFDLQIAAGKATNWVSVDVIDNYTIKITVKVYQNTSLTGVSGYPIASKAAFDKNGIAWARENPIGTGPFVFVEHERGTRVYFEKNENYWDTGKPYLDGVEFIIIADVTVRNLAFKRGDIHEFTAAGLDAKELQDARYPYHQRTGGTFVLVPDSANLDSPFSNLKVRQAVSYAIDRESLAKNLGYGFARPAYQIFPGFKIAVVPNLEKTFYDPVKARQLLTEAGYPDGFTTSIYSQGYAVPSNYVTAVAGMLTEIGIITTPEFPDSGKYSEYRFGSWSKSLLAQGFGNFDNLNSLWGFYFGTTAFKSRENPANFKAAAEASLASPEVDPALVQACVKIIAEELMVIPYLEETVMIFQVTGAHNAGLDIATQTQFWAHVCWLEAKAR